jgi:ribosomal protein S11
MAWLASGTCKHKGKHKKAQPFALAIAGGQHRNVLARTNTDARL